MGELWVREFQENVQSTAVFELRVNDISFSDIYKADAFYRLLYASLYGLYRYCGSFVFRLIYPAGKHDDYLISKKEQLYNILLSVYKKDFSYISDFFIKNEVNASFTLSISRNLSFFADGVLIKRFDEEKLDEEIDTHIVNLYVTA